MNKRFMYSKLFQLKIYESDGYGFQHLFEKVMKSKHSSNFSVVKPTGKIGDKKNDGYLNENHTYYQVYGPENIANSIKYAISKIKTDVDGLLKEWCNANSIFYVVNDKFKGFSPEVHQGIEEIKNELAKLSKSKGILIKLFSAQDLLNIFLSLDEIYQIDIVGTIEAYDYSIEEILTYDDFSKVINHILSLPYIEQKDTLFPPDYDKKIEVNAFSDEIRERLKIAHLNNADLQGFFSNCNPTIEESIKNRLSNLYLELCVKYNDDSDLIFEGLVRDLSPIQTRAAVHATESIVSYYFESCDIFKSTEGLE